MIAPEFKASANSELSSNRAPIEKANDGNLLSLEDVSSWSRRKFTPYAKLY